MRWPAAHARPARRRPGIARRRPARWRHFAPADARRRAARRPSSVAEKSPKKTACRHAVAGSTSDQGKIRVLRPSGSETRCRNRTPDAPLVARPASGRIARPKGGPNGALSS
ncbi:hypothetical protein DP43_5545 [Burkholderia pseudomallei]|nr:hypothetical protein DP43_5545 [Burkholderia pseudomallei]